MYGSHVQEHFDAVDQGERYKWEAIAWYKKHWKIDSPNFAQMLEDAFGKAKNLLASAMYYPYRMVMHELCHFIHPNHSKHFYAFLSMLMPDWKERKKVLDANDTYYL